MSGVSETVIELSASLFDSLRSHLLPNVMHAEEAAFLFAHVANEERGLRFRVIDWYPVPEEGFVERSLYYLELTDETRGLVIKKAHDLRCSLIEAHSHSGKHPAEFSQSDKRGFDEFVPHVLWRLKRRPYAAMVMATNSIDALAWQEESEGLQVAAIQAGDRSITTTALTLANHADG